MQPFHSSYQPTQPHHNGAVNHINDLDACTHPGTNYYDEFWQKGDEHESFPPEPGLLSDHGNSPTTLSDTSREAGETPRQSRPLPVRAPPCTFAVQNHFSVKGTLLDSKFVCHWFGCVASFFQETFEDFESFFSEVCKHIDMHARQIRVDNRCQWLPCTSGTLNGSQCTRNNARHITTHLAWYFLCPRCASVRARHDAPPGLCPQTCVAGDPVVKANLAAAYALFGDKLTMQYVWEQVLGHQPEPERPYTFYA